MVHPRRRRRPPSLPPTYVLARRGRNRRSCLLHRRPRKLPHGGFVEEAMGLEVAQQRDGEGWGREEKRKQGCHICMPRHHGSRV
jgi:hypothetical protein